MRGNSRQHTAWQAEDTNKKINNNNKACICLFCASLILSATKVHVLYERRGATGINFSWLNLFAEVQAYARESTELVPLKPAAAARFTSACMFLAERVGIRHFYELVTGY